MISSQRLFPIRRPLAAMLAGAAADFYGIGVILLALGSLAATVLRRPPT